MNQDRRNGSSVTSAATKVRSAHSRPGLFLMTNSLEIGGSERQFVALAKSVDAAAFRVQLGCIGRRGALVDGLGNLPEFPLGGSLYGLQSVWARLRLAQFLRRNQVSIAHAFDFYTNLTLIPAARLAGVPVVIGSQRQLGDLLSRSQSHAQAAIFGWCDAVICNSQAAAERLVEQGVQRSRVVVIGNGLPDEAFAETRPAVARRPGILRVGMIARMNSRAKNHHLFLRAAARLCNRCPGLEFLVVGDGPLRPELERQTETLGLKSQVLFLGERKDIPAILGSLDVCVQPSSSESLSNVILESMAAGLPVVASRVGGNPELLAEGKGILVAPDDDRAFADAIERLLREPASRAEFGNNAKRFARAHFTMEYIRRRYEQLYSDLLKKHSRHANSGCDRCSQDQRQRTRVVLVAASSRYVGGQSVQADMLLRHWQDDPGVEARFVPIDPLLPQPLAWFERIPFLRTLLREPIYVALLWRKLKDVDIAHIFSASYWSFYLAPMPAWLIARLLGVKTVIHYHSGEAREHLQRFRRVRPVLESADRLVVPSEFLVGLFREFGLQAHIVPNIVDLRQFTFRDRKPLHPKLLCTRAFHRYYGLDVVVHAFAEVQRAFPDATLSLVGKGPLEQQIRALVRDLNLSGVEFVGAVPHGEIARFYDGADIFINASNLDNMPVSILEAFASGTPVVTTAPEGMSYLVEHERTGLLSKPGDAQALAQNVIRLLTETKLASRLASNARDEVRHYCWESVRRKWLEVYDSLGSDRVSTDNLALRRSAGSLIDS